jgi:regulator of nucleoside diphosphate kinase
MMKHRNDVVISTRDAEALAYMLRGQARPSPLASTPADDLADVLLGATLLPLEKVGGDRVVMNAPVTYEEQPGGARRRVVLVLPEAVDASAGRISVLSPIGRALIGRRRGARVALSLPNGRRLDVRILETSSSPEALREAA